MAAISGRGPRHCSLFRLCHRRLWRIAELKRAAEALSSTTPVLSPQSSTSCVHSQDNDSLWGETGSVPGEHQHKNTIVELLLCYYICAHVEENYNVTVSWNNVQEDSNVRIYGRKMEAPEQQGR